MKLSLNRIRIPVTLLFLLAVTVVFFYGTIGPGKTLFGSDANIGHMAYTQAELPGSFLGRWVENGLVGNPSYMPLKFTSFLMMIIPITLYMSILIPLELILASASLMLFLRGRGIRWLPAACGAIAAYWVGSNFTLVYAGHIGKFGVLAFASLTLWLIDLAARRKSPLVAVLAGAAWGQTFMEQADVAFLFGLFLGAYAVYACIRECGTHWFTSVTLLAPLGLVAALFAFGPLSVGYFQNVKSASVMEEQSDPEAKWEFVTQWSWPPGESIDFIAPGYFGWRSGDPEGPYWGKMGRNKGWETTRSGFMNFRLENEYLGLLPFLLAIAAIWFACRGHHRRDTMFWSIAALVALFLSFGKFSILYRLAYHFPVISYVRAPVKFLQVFQIALAILAAMGLNSWLQSGNGSDSKPTAPPPLTLKWVFAGVTGALTLAWLGATFAADTKLQSLVSFGWPEATAQVIVANIRSGLLHAIIVGLIGSGFAMAMERSNLTRWRGMLGGALLLVMLVDAFMLSRHYVKPSDTRPVKNNQLALALAQTQGNGRCFAVDQNPVYNNLTSVTFPFHGLEFFNITQMPRMAADNRQFLEVFGRNVISLWQLTASETLLMSEQTLQQFASAPGMRELVNPIHRFDLRTNANGDIEANALPPETTGGHLIVKFRLPAARYALFSDWAPVPAEDALVRMQQPDFRPMQQVLVSGEVPAFMTEVDITPTPMQPVQVLSHDARHRKLRATSEVPSVLRISERYHPDWQVTVNGKPADLLRCDFLFQAVCLPAGIHEVELTYAPSPAPWILQLLGYALSGCAGLVLASRRFAPPKVTEE